MEMSIFPNNIENNFSLSLAPLEPLASPNGYQSHSPSHYDSVTSTKTKRSTLSLSPSDLNSQKKTEQVQEYLTKEASVSHCDSSHDYEIAGVDPGLIDSPNYNHPNHNHTLRSSKFSMSLPSKNTEDRTIINNDARDKTETSKVVDIRNNIQNINAESVSNRGPSNDSAEKKAFIRRSPINSDLKTTKNNNGTYPSPQQLFFGEKRNQVEGGRFSELYPHNPTTNEEPLQVNGVVNRTRIKYPYPKSTSSYYCPFSLASTRSRLGNKLRVVEYLKIFKRRDISSYYPAKPSLEEPHANKTSKFPHNTSLKRESGNDNISSTITSVLEESKFETFEQLKMNRWCGTFVVVTEKKTNLEIDKAEGNNGAELNASEGNPLSPERQKESNNVSRCADESFPMRSLASLPLGVDIPLNFIMNYQIGDGVCLFETPDEIRESEKDQSQENFRQLRKKDYHARSASISSSNSSSSISSAKKFGIKTNSNVLPTEGSSKTPKSSTGKKRSTNPLRISSISNIVIRALFPRPYDAPLMPHIPRLLDDEVRIDANSYHRRQIVELRNKREKYRASMQTYNNCEKGKKSSIEANDALFSLSSPSKIQKIPAEEQYQESCEKPKTVENELLESTSEQKKSNSNEKNKDKSGVFDFANPFKSIAKMVKGAIDATKARLDSGPATNRYCFYFPELSRGFIGTAATEEEKDRVKVNSSDVSRPRWPDKWVGEFSGQVLHNNDTFVSGFFIITNRHLCFVSDPNTINASVSVGTNINDKEKNFVTSSYFSSVSTVQLKKSNNQKYHHHFDPNATSLEGTDTSKLATPNTTTTRYTTTAPASSSAVFHERNVTNAPQSVDDSSEMNIVYEPQNYFLKNDDNNNNNVSECRSGDGGDRGEDNDNDFFDTESLRYGPSLDGGSTATGTTTATEYGKKRRNKEKKATTSNSTMYVTNRRGFGSESSSTSPAYLVRAIIPLEEIIYIEECTRERIAAVHDELIGNQFMTHRKKKQIKMKNAPDSGLSFSEEDDDSGSEEEEEEIEGELVGNENGLICNVRPVTVFRPLACRGSAPPSLQHCCEYGVKSPSSATEKNPRALSSSSAPPQPATLQIYLKDGHMLQIANIKSNFFDKEKPTQLLSPSSSDSGTPLSNISKSKSENIERIKMNILEEEGNPTDDEVSVSATSDALVGKNYDDDDCDMKVFEEIGYNDSALWSMFNTEIPKNEEDENNERKLQAFYYGYLTERNLIHERQPPSINTTQNRDFRCILNRNFSENKIKMVDPISASAMAASDARLTYISYKQSVISKREANHINISQNFSDDKLVSASHHKNIQHQLFYRKSTDLDRFEALLEHYWRKRVSTAMLAHHFSRHDFFQQQKKIKNDLKN